MVSRYHSFEADVGHGLQFTLVAKDPARKRCEKLDQWHAATQLPEPAS